MGVWHISGLGTSPGAVTTPLTIVYLLKKAAQQGSTEARDFFLGSGQAEDEEWVGAPEAVVLLSSREVIEGDILPNNIDDRLFNLSRTQGPAPWIIWRYLSRLHQELWGEDLKIKLFLLATQINDIDRVMRDAGVTVGALRDKEIWVNMTAGPNTINLSLLISSVILGAAARYYYIFHPQTGLLHPEGLPPRNLRNPVSIVANLLKLWIDVPIFQMELEPLLRRLNERYSGSNIINRAELESICREYGVGLEKLKRLIYFEGQRTYPGPLFKRYLGLLSPLSDSPSNYSEWIKWGTREGVLYKLDNKTGRAVKL